MGTDLKRMNNPDYSIFYMADTIVTLVKSGKLPGYLLDEKVRNILYVMCKINMINGNRKKGEYNSPAHQQTAATVAEEGIVLLKNENNFLPLQQKKIRTIAVIGANADRKQSMGGGSSQVRAFYEITPLQGIQNLAGRKVKVTFSPGYLNERGATANAGLISDAVVAASKADVVIYVGGSTHGYDYSKWGDNAYDAEEVDKPDMKMPFGQDELLKAVLMANPKTVVVLIGGGAIDMTQWIDKTPAILQAWYAGMEGGNALAKIVFGQVNPSGKLPMSFPKKLEDNPSHALGEYPGDLDALQVHYLDDIYVGYRYYDTYKVKPQFAFGHGLSYTQFEYSDLITVMKNNGEIEVSFSVKNTGSVAGAEVSQLYVSQKNPSLPRPDKELKGFEKVFLQAGEQKTISIILNNEAFQYYNDIKHAWVMERGKFEVRVGTASDKIYLNKEIEL